MFSYTGFLAPVGLGRIPRIPAYRSGLVSKCSAFMIFTEPFWGDNFLVARQSGYYRLRVRKTHDMRP